jgi:hypothetical protein
LQQIHPNILQFNEFQQNQLNNGNQLQNNQFSQIEQQLLLKQQIEQQTNSRNRVISILSWDKYQQTEQQTDSKRTTTEQQVDTNNNDNNIKNEMYIICNKEKHQIEHFTNLNKNEEGKENFHKSTTFQLSEYIKEVEINKESNDLSHLKQVYKEKSEKMSGTGNHNYGKQFSEEHKKKISHAIRDAKGGVSDETILEVRKLLKEGNPNVEIQEKLQLSRHTVSRIKCGKIICRTEEKVIKDKTTQEERNIAKRKIKIDEILIVIDKLIKNDRPTVILEFLNDIRNSYKNYDYLNIDVIKNIKRNICQNKLPFYQSEINTEDYEYYKQSIEQYCIGINKI